MLNVSLLNRVTPLALFVGEMGRWGEKGEGPGHFTNGPHGVFIDDEDSLYVAEVGGNNRLQKFARV